MKIPAGHYQRQELYQELILAAFATRPARVAMYDILKNYFFWGCSQETQPVEYNKLAAHLDLLASFLFSGETTTFVVEDDEDADGEPDFELQKCMKITPKINRYWNNSNIDIVFDQALIWALVYQCMFIKLVPRKGTALFDAYAVEPHAIGVLLEHEPMLDKQPCIVHEHFITKSDLEILIKHLPEPDRKMILSLCGPVRPPAAGSATVASTGTDRLILAAQTPDGAQAGSVSGNVINPIAVQYDFSPQINEDVVLAQEVWVWDDDKADYRCAKMLDGEYLLFDDGNNPFVPKEQPLIKICPNSVYNYFWGITELLRLIPIQEWVNERIPEIKQHLKKQTDPPKSASGMGAYSDEKASALSIPGGMLFEEQQGLSGKVDQHLPAPINVFEILDRAEMMFAEVSGIRELMQGKGESGVRAMSHANLLVRVGSSRVKKKASILEDAVEKVGHLILCLMKKYDATQYKTDSGTSFVAAHVSEKASVKVDSHSSSPIFVEQQSEKAQVLFKAQAIDREDLIDAMKPQNQGYLKRKLRKRMAAEAEAAKREAAKEEAEKKGA
jgi:hypothetical protein